MSASASYPLDPAPAPSSGGAEALADAAEEVRAWLVSARGGAPFLSGADARLLADWLESGVAVADLLRAIDETARHRRARRLRGPFTLRGVERALRTPPASPRRPRPAPPADTVPWPDAAAVEAELATLAPLQAAARVRRFFEAAWADLAAHHAALLADALAELGEAADMLEPDDRARIAEEYARERLRSRYPSLRPGALLG